MNTPRRLRIFVPILAVSAALVACGGAPSAAEPTALPEPTVAPTSTPRPAIKVRPTTAPKPTAEPEPTTEPEPTSESSGVKLRDVVIGDLEPYTHSNNLFTVDVPNNWTLKDNSKPSEAIVTWIDEAENAFMQVDIFKQSQEQTDEEMANFLKEYLQNTFGSFEDFSQDPAKASGSSQLIVWSYTGEGDNSVKAKLLGNSFIERAGDKMSLFTIVVPDQQFNDLKPQLDTILNSYVVDQQASIDVGDTTVTISDLETYYHDSGLFQIDVPTGWRLTDNSKANEKILTWAAPNGLATIVVDLFKSDETKSSDQLTDMLKTFLNQTFGSEDNFTIDDPKEQSDGSVLMVWAYNDKTRDGLKVLGNSFIEQHGDKISLLTMVVPDEQFDTLHSKTDDIINSYSIDESVAID